MVFRADESERSGIQEVENYLISKNIPIEERSTSKDMLFEIIDKYGPVINGYPSWHPLVTHHENTTSETRPNEKCGYKGLDHTRFFLNAFITCPYDDGKKVISSVGAFPRNDIVSIKAEKLDAKFYTDNATPILVSCTWHKDIESSGMIPAAIAIPLMLQKEIPCWTWASFGETWESMRPYFLGSPHGSRSSLFVDQDTGLTMKKIWNLLINTGMYGPIKVTF